MSNTTAPQLSIYTLTPDDHDAFYSIRCASLKQSPHSYGNHLSAWENARPEQINALLEHSAQNTEGCILGATLEGTEGLAGLLGIRHETKPNVRHKATLWGFFIRPEHRQKGIGAELVREALERCRNVEELHHVRLILTARDVAAHKVFTSCGFGEYGREPNGLYYGGVFMDQVYMMHVLQRPA